MLVKWQLLLLIVEIVGDHCFLHFDLFNVGDDLYIQYGVSSFKLEKPIRFVSGHQLVKRCNCPCQDLILALDVCWSQLLDSSSFSVEQRLGYFCHFDELIETEPIKLENQVIRLHLLRILKQTLRTCKIGKGTKAPDSLERRDGCRLNSVRILVSLDSILVSSSGHEQVSSVNVHHGVLRVGQDQPLEVQEGQIVVTDEVGAFTPVNVSLLQGLVEV